MCVCVCVCVCVNQCVCASVKVSERVCDPQNYKQTSTLAVSAFLTGMDAAFPMIFFWKLDGVKLEILEMQKGMLCNV